MSERTIRDVIEGRDMLTAQIAMTVGDAARLMRDRLAGAMLVLDGEQLVGIFTERDALFRVVAGGLDANTTTVAEVMTAEPTAISPDKSFAAALETMHTGQFRHLPVVEGERCIGMVSSRDAMGPELEQFMYTLIIDEQNRDVPGG